jgi:hypothetical protein
LSSNLQLKDRPFFTFLQGLQLQNFMMRSDVSDPRSLLGRMTGR